jgi:MFS-type transporter involved in bile tolerance (Atg22 family)
MNISVEHFTETWLPNDSDAENTVVKIYAMMWLLSAILMPILGVFVDYVGHRSTLVSNYIIT